MTTYNISFFNSNTYTDLSKEELINILLMNKKYKIEILEKINCETQEITPLVAYYNIRLGDEYLNSNKFSEFNDFEKGIIIKYNEFRYC